MSYKERIPGMELGNRNRNIIVGSGYGLLLLFLLANFASVIALLLILSPIIIAVVVGKNYKGLASELATLPGISDRGGIQAGISAFVYTIVLVGVLMGGLTALAPVEDTPEEETEVPEGEGEAEAEAAEEEATDDDLQTVTVTVVDENGDPIENADVEFVHDDAIIFDTRENKQTDSDGIVEFETESDSNVDINVEADGYENTDASLTVSEDEEITLTLQEAPEETEETEETEEEDEAEAEAAEDDMSTVTITVVDEDGDPVENADVEFVHDDAIIFDTRENKPTNSDGVVSFETEANSNVDINVEADGYENTDASLTVSEDEEITLTLQEEPEETEQDTESTEDDSADASGEDEAEEETEATEEQQNTEAEASDDSSSDESDESSSSEGDSSDSADETESSDAGIEVRISYSGDWSGSVGGDGTSSSVDGSGDETIPIDGDPATVSASIQKQDDSNDELTVAIVEDGEVIVEESTTAEYGVVTVSEVFF